MKIKIDAEFKALIPPLSEDERSQLEANLVADGCREPLVIWQGENILLDGHNRHEICTRRGIAYETTPLELDDRDAATAWIIRNQFGRRNLPIADRVKLALRLEPLLAAEAHKRKVATLKKGDSAPDPSELTERDKGDTRTKLAKVAGVSTGTFSKVKHILENADDVTVERVRRGESSIDYEYNRLRRGEKFRETLATVNEEVELPDGNFRVIVADPPWKHAWQKSKPEVGLTDCLYPTMTVDEIKALPVERLAHDDAVLWLWATNNLLGEAFDVVRAWGFDPKSVLTWAKNRSGTGYYLRGQTEHCILATRGKPLFDEDHRPATLLKADRREHSRKPDEFYELVEAYCPGSKLELFSRERRDGWEHHGNEINRFSEVA